MQISCISFGKLFESLFSFTLIPFQFISTFYCTNQVCFMLKNTKFCDIYKTLLTTLLLFCSTILFEAIFRLQRFTLNAFYRGKVKKQWRKYMKNIETFSIFQTNFKSIHRKKKQLCYPKYISSVQLGIMLEYR